MQFKVRSLKFLEEIQRRRGEFAGRTAAARIQVPTELAWWFYQEFGTASRATMGTTNPDGYDIVAVEAAALSFPVEGGKRVITTKVHHPGVYPRAFIRLVLDDIVAATYNDVAKALSESGYTFESIRQAIVSKSIVNAKELIADSMSEQLTGTRPDGKLEGRAAAEVYRDQATTLDTSS